MSNEPILSVRDLSIAYQTGKNEEVTAVSGVNLDLYAGQSLALVGESGCGKTTLGLGLLRLLPTMGQIRSGELNFRRKDGSIVDLMQLKREPMRRFRWSEAAIVFQGAMNAFNPVRRIQDHFADTLIDHAHQQKWTKKEIEERSAELLEMVRLEPARVLPAFPHELSGGMKQRALIALAMALNPQLLILDEPTTALDLLTQRGIVQQLHEIREKFGFTMVFITHDLGLAAELSDRVATMYAGRIIETGTSRDIFYNPQHPYTAGLINAVMPVKGDLPALESIPGSPPSLSSLPSGCAFEPRCSLALGECSVKPIPLQTITKRYMGRSHAAACVRPGEVDFDRRLTHDDPAPVPLPNTVEHRPASTTRPVRGAQPETKGAANV
ncbi:ABC transporter ATP-binding protein [Natronoglycomyces albus]|uniref:ABC transporter ATP-binding protein n=1 Tax=Natronoglycomyces albus TaxID=2811108 RepID=A0A895XNX7_9ACTN|nr:ABC transporter ATP-binding protein [Natronoglycomyces albus]QSB05089.1 ABC transporter ATP-binding protein [Natronoglycomyces albus]